MSTKAVYEKLRLAEGSSVLVINSPSEYKELIGSVPESVSISTDPQPGMDFVHLFVSSKADLDEYIDTALKAVKHDGLLWVSYPKGSSKVDTDINRDILWELLKPKGIRPVTQISINETWSALRFKPQEAVGK